MTETKPLAPELTRRILRHFGLEPDLRTDLASLQELVTAYTRTVPWESASRIVRRAQHDSAENCVLYGTDFWDSHFTLGAGGTCYESNYAFYALLRRLGYAGYLTINNMGEAIGCHSAIVVQLDGRKHLVDVGYPVHAVLPLDVNCIAQTNHAVMNYTVEPIGEGRYEIRRLSSQPHSGFTLVDEPVSDADYRAIGIHDYRPDGGQFLKEIVIHKVLAGQLWRFNSADRPLRIQQFIDGERRDHRLGGDPAGEVAAKFGIAREVVAQAMRLLGLDAD